MKNLLLIFIVAAFISLDFYSLLGFNNPAPPSIGDKVWNDLNKDGIQDSDEYGIENVIVNLYEESSNLISTTTTDENGLYVFEDIVPGNYYLSFDASNLGEYMPTKPNIGFENKDSDLDNSNGSGTTATFTLIAGEIKTNIDAGFYLLPPGGCDGEVYEECSDAPVYCELNELNDHCVEMDTINQNTPIPGCGGGYAFHNPSWHAFVAGAENISIILHAFNCVNDNQGASGLQWGIYDDCDMENPFAVQCACVEPEDISIDLAGFTVDQTYHFFVDGCNGAQCSYWIEVLSGGGSPDIIGPSEIVCDNDGQDCDNICKYDELTFTLEDVFNASYYIWSVNGDIDTTNTPDKSITFYNIGTYTICGYGKSNCSGGEEKCMTVLVEDCGCGIDSIDFKKENNNCNKDCLGEIKITNVFGASLPIKYKWNTGDTLSYIDSLCSGLYSIMITDSNNCVFIDTFEISSHEEMKINSSQLNVTCFGSCDGSIAILNVTNSNPPLKYKWSTGSESALVNNLCAGDYFVTITDSIGCSIVDSFIISSPNKMKVNVSKIDASCYGVCDGTLALLSVQNSNPPLKYKWSTGSESVLINNLCAGDYFVTITDSLGCQLIDTLSILQPNEIAVTVDSFSNITDSGLGSIFVNTNNNGKYTYKWSGPNGYTNTSEDILNLATEGCYSLIITDTLTNCHRDTTICILNTTGTIEQSFNSINLYPNPTSGTTLIDFRNSNVNKAKITVYNIEGQKILNIGKNENEEMIKVELIDMDSGLYFIKINTVNETIVKKLVLGKIN